MINPLNIPNKRKTATISLVALLILAVPAICWAFAGKVVGISDGDTITVMHDGRGEKIRLYGIDCPESHQDFGQRAKQFTSSMVFGKLVEVQPKATDRYGRTVGLVMVDGKVLNEEMIKAGRAWVYVKYCRDSFCGRWYGFEDDARRKRVGLWGMANAVPPWEFRRSMRVVQ